MTIGRREVMVGAAVALAAAGRTRGMLLHLSPGSLGVKGTPRQILDWASKFGFDSIDADARSVGEIPAADLKAGNVVWGLAGLPVEFRRDDARFRETMAAFPEQVKKLRAAGVERMSTWISPGSNDLTFLENLKQHAARLREAALVLQDHGLRLGLEYVGPKTLWSRSRFPFVHTMREMKELIGAINVPNVGFVLDSWHWYTAHETKEDLLTLKARDVVSVDLNDAPAGLPIDEQIDSKRELPAATGVIDVKTFLGALQQIGFDGPVRAEPFNEPLRKMAPEDALAATIAAMKKAFAL